MNNINHHSLSKLRIKKCNALLGENRQLDNPRELGSINSLKVES